MVTTIQPTESSVWQVLHLIPDPDIPVLDIVELGVVRSVSILSEKKVVVTITPSYSGCPAMGFFKDQIKSSLQECGFQEVEIKINLSPAWTTEWMSDIAKAKLKAHGIAPPENDAEGEFLFSKHKRVTCPKCGTKDSKLISQFGATPCKALWYCNTCEQPFEYFKCY